MHSCSWIAALSALLSSLMVSASEGVSVPLWQPPLAQLTFIGKEQDQFQLEVDESGVAAITRYIRKGPNDIAQYLVNPQLDLQHANIAFDLKLESEFEFPLRDHKLPLGLWGGTNTSSCFSGGCNPKLQDGFSVRLVESAGAPYLYAYSLSRPGADGSAKSYGELIGCNCDFTLPRGRWVSVEISIHLNSDTRAADRISLLVDHSVLINKHPLKLRQDESWLIKGPMLTDMFGGSVFAYSNMSPKAQQVWYKNYRITAG